MRKLALIAVGVALVAGCGTPPTPAAAPPPPLTGTAAAPGAFNDTDIMFLQMLIPHHGQGISITELIGDRPVRPEVATLAAAIRSTQQDEVTTMSGWLRQWRQPATAPAGAHEAHGGMPGTSQQELAAVRAKTGPEFERAFLNLLIAHQDDAAQIARMELAGGTEPAARRLADEVNKSRTAQISQMLALLG